MWLVHRLRILVAVIVALALAPTVSAAAPIVGRASVVDGDTIEVGKLRIRLSGIDAPEHDQICTDQSDKRYLCGQEAATALDAWLAKSRPVTCTPSGHDRYHRTVANCRRADGSSVNAWLVENGYAVDWPKYSHGVFSAAQDRAMAADRGIWRGWFELPCRYRAEKAHQSDKC
jgi:endonuclease YncB( thermonuclease family)